MDSITRYRGDTLKFGVAIKDDAGVPQSLADCLIHFKLSNLTEGSEGVQIIRDDPIGEFLVVISDELMRGLSADHYKFHVALEYADGTIEHLFVLTLFLEDTA